MDNTPTCPQCGAKMIKRIAKKGSNAGNYFYGCSKWPNCNGTINIQPKVKPQTNPKTPPPQSNRPYTNIKNLNFPIDLIARPRAKGFKTVFIDSLALPKNLFAKFNNNPNFRNQVQSFAKWRIDFTPSFEKSLTEKQTTILSIIEKIVNRGRLTRLSEDLETKILNLTDETSHEYKNNITLSSYSNYHEPNLPNEWHDGQKRPDLSNMTAEEFFYKKIFIEKIGKNQARDIIPQVSFNSLILDKTDLNASILSQRVDFLITHNQEAIAVEIDDPTHSNHQKKDTERDRILEANGLKVYRVDVQDLVKNGKSLLRLSQKLESIYQDKTPSHDIYKSLIAIKLAHQFQLILIELVKYGKIGYGKKCKVAFGPNNIPKLEKSTQKKLLDFALQDLCELSHHVAKIYKSQNNIFSNIEIDDEDPDLLISVNDNYQYDQNKIVYIQDINYPLALEQNKFAKLSKQETIADEDSLEFILNYIFRFPNFRPNQIDGIKQTLSGEDSIVLLPTGSGKSIVYQLLSFILPGMIAVIDPITSLVEDQVDNLLRQGIDRIAGITASTKNKNYLQNALESGQYNLLFISPERLQIDAFRNSLKKFCTWSTIPVCAIDEAHCVSEWGHDFRTSYLNLANTCRKLLRTQSGPPAILALTGTASEAVLKDMERDLNIPDKYVIRPTSFDRKEIKFIVVPASSSTKSITLQKIIKEDLPRKFQMTFEEFYSANQGQTMSGIIFCPHISGRYGTLRILKDMNSLGINTKEYSGSKPKNAPMTDEDWSQHKTNVAQQYKDNAFPLLAATKSFGMGIDKPNIRYTIHYSLPPSIESYYQEAGRAGRDRKRAYSYIIISNDYPEYNKKLLSPSSTLEDLQESIKKHGWGGDDVDRALYFHTHSFGGINTELVEAKNVLDSLGDLTHTKNVTIACLSSSREKTERVIYRLSILGVVKDYTINYSANEFCLTLNAFNREQVIKNYGKYVRGYQNDDNYVQAAETMLHKISQEDPKEFILQALSILLKDFVYKIIENSRRQAFANLLDITTKASYIVDEEYRSKMLRHEILKFLGNTHIDIIRQISDNPDNLAQIKSIVDNLSANAKANLYAEVGRALEAYPQHPGLLLTRLRIKIDLEDYDPLEIADSVTTILGFSTQLYNIPLSKSIPAITSALEKIEKSKSTKYAKIINLIINDYKISSSIKDYLADAIPEKYRRIVLINKLNHTFTRLDNCIGKENLWTANK